MQYPSTDPAQDSWQVMAQGRTLEAQGQAEQAIALYRAWLLQHPNARESLTCWYEFGRLLFVQKHHAQAENAFRAALEIHPQFLEASLALGKALEAQGQLAEALQVWQAARPSKALQIELLNNIARVSEGMHKTEQAEEALIDSLQLDNHQSAVLTTLLQQRQKLCRWPVITDGLGIPAAVQQEHVGPLMSLALFDDPAANLASARRFLADKPYHPDRLPAPLVTAGRVYPNHPKLRLGFLSADFRLHATSVFFMPIIEHLDRQRFEVVLLDITAGLDPFPFARQQLLALADQVLPLQTLSDDEAVQAIAAAEIDVLIDMAGLTAGARPAIVARRPAPVQMSYIGFLGSSGIPNIDYLLTTRDLFPYDFAASFSEKPLEIEGSYLSFTYDPPVDTGTRRADCDLDDDAFVFCALLNSYKITPDMFALWMDILHGVPDSLLWLVEENPTMRANLEHQAARHGIAPRRLRFSQRVHPAEYRTRLGLADLFLDSSPYGNGATTRDVLSADLPILTKPGHTMMSRLTAHMISAVGLSELVVHDAEAYKAKAIALGQDRAAMRRLKQQLIDNKPRSALFDTQGFAQRFGEAVLRGVAQMQTDPTT